MQLTAIIEREDSGYVALCPQLDIASQGESVAEARENLTEALELFFETAERSEVERRLHGDANVSRANHARVAYDPRERRWMLSHCDGANLTYLNGEVVMAAVPIESGAQIQIGETTLRFQAFCSQEFDWPDVDD